MKFYKFLMFFLFCFSCYAMAERNVLTDNISCRIEFEHNSTKFDSNDTHSCYNNTPIENIKSINVIGSASPVGGQLYNKLLSVRRARGIAAEIRKNIPKTIPLKVSGIGMNKTLQRSVIVKLILKEAIPVTCGLPNKESEKTAKKIDKKEKNNFSPQNQQKEIKKNESPVSAIWVGAIGVVSPGLSKFAKNPIHGFQIGVKKTFYSLTENTSFYSNLIYEQAKGSKTSADLGVLTGINNTAKLAIANISLLGGLEYEAARYFSLFGEAGISYTQRSILITNAERQLLSSFQYNTFDPTINIGSLIYIPLNENYRLFVRTAAEFMFGRKRNVNLYKTPTEFNNTNMNSYLIIPTFSVGVNF